MKNGIELEFVLTDETVVMLEWYISNYRKAAPGNRYLFAGEGSSHKVENTLRSQIMETVHTFTGLTVNPHLFRAIAGTIYLDANPGAYETVRLVLGHKSINTTTRFYVPHMEQKARQHYTNTVCKLREADDTSTLKPTKGVAASKKRKL